MLKILQPMRRLPRAGYVLIRQKDGQNVMSRLAVDTAKLFFKEKPENFLPPSGNIIKFTARANPFL